MECGYNAIRNLSIKCGNLILNEIDKEAIRLGSISRIYSGKSSACLGLAINDNGDM